MQGIWGQRGMVCGTGEETAASRRGLEELATPAPGLRDRTLPHANLACMAVPHRRATQQRPWDRRSLLLPAHPLRGPRSGWAQGRPRGNLGAEGPGPNGGRLSTPAHGTITARAIDGRWACPHRRGHPKPGILNPPQASQAVAGRQRLCENQGKALCLQEHSFTQAQVLVRGARLDFSPTSALVQRATYTTICDSPLQCSCTF